MSRFSHLTRRFSPKETIESLIYQDETPEPQGFTRSSTRVMSKEYDVNRPQDELDEYWRLYETNPLIGFPINTTASKVMEPGWYITADSEDTVDELTEFFENVAIVNGEPHQNFSQLGQQAVIQHQVKGTFLAEDVRNSSGLPMALNPLQPDTFEINTKPGSNILLAPDDTDMNGVKKTEGGSAAAYVQFDANDPRWDDRKEKRFSRDQILKWTRGNEVGEVFGTSRVESVYERALALEAKLRDNDDAIAMKAWPMVLFQMGSEDSPWRKSEMSDFMEDFDAENFGPGLMKAVSGDVSVEEFAGETADIESAVETDVSFIMAGMPGPKYALGGFATTAGQAVAEAQDRQYTKLVRRLRRDVEQKFTPYLREVAEEYGLDAADSVELKIQRPDGEVAPEDVSGSIVRYTSDADPENQGTPQQGQQQQSQGGSRDGDGDGRVNEDGDSSMIDSMEPAPEYIPEGSTELLETGCSTSQGCSVDELADSRLVGTRDIESDLQDTIYSVLKITRDQTLQRVQNRYDNTSDVGPERFESIVNSAFYDAVAREELTSNIESALRRTVQATMETLNQDNHKPQLDVSYSSRHAQVVGRNASELESDVEDAGDDITRTVRRQMAQAIQGNEPIEDWASRVRDRSDNGTLRDRSRVISHMRVQRVVNGIKMGEYERSDEVSGVRVTNPCTDSTTPLCERLAGCGRHSAPTSTFDSEQTIGQQLAGDVPDDLLFSGFDPLPSVPPFHFGCRSELVPIVDE